MYTPDAGNRPSSGAGSACPGSQLGEGRRRSRDQSAPGLDLRGDGIAGRGRRASLEIQQFSVSKLLYARFKYSTGDAAGQNMTGEATFAACAWIKQNYPDEQHFLLEGQFATDEKTSVMNMLHVRGKRVLAEITLPAAPGSRSRCM